MYIERKMTPLNLYLQEETDEEKITRALDELGLCIKQIAMANIFPGDMLHKNFGITRHGRVIFYDYDEICLMMSSDSVNSKLDAHVSFNSSISSGSILSSGNLKFTYSWVSAIRPTRSDIFTSL